VHRNMNVATRYHKPVMSGIVGQFAWRSGRKDGFSGL
jgi:hypothetical protein